MSKSRRAAYGGGSSSSFASLEGLTKQQKIMAGASVGVIAIALIMIVVFIASSGMFKGPVKPPDSAAHRTANEVSAKLYEEGFLDVGVAVVSEEPLQYVVNGAVHSSEDLTRLKSRLAELMPGEEMEMNVELLKR